eukprot:1823798-Pyramimonas_sp.AAC.1
MSARQAITHIEPVYTSGTATATKATQFTVVTSCLQQWEVEPRQLSSGCFATSAPAVLGGQIPSSTRGFAQGLS